MNHRLNAKTLIGLLAFIVVLCDLLTQNATSLEISGRGLAVIGIVSALAAWGTLRLSAQAIDTAHNVPSPQQDRRIDEVEEERNAWRDAYLSLRQGGGLPRPTPKPSDQADTQPRGQVSQ